MSEEPHAVVRLLLKRMESHPEEFKRIKMFGSRWSEYVNDIEELGSEADKAAIGKAMQNIRMNEIHEAVMDELVNGPERRREEEETQQQAARASQLYAKGATAGQALATSKDGYTWTKLDHDAYLAQSRNMQNSLQGAQQSALMQSQLGYGGGIVMPATTASALGLKTETASEALTGVINKLLGR